MGMICSLQSNGVTLPNYYAIYNNLRVLLLYFDDINAAKFAIIFFFKLYPSTHDIPIAPSHKYNYYLKVTLNHMPSLNNKLQVKCTHNPKWQYMYPSTILIDHIKL